MKLLIEEIRLLEARIAQLERELTEVAKHSPACTTLLSIPGDRLVDCYGDGGRHERQRGALP